MSETTVTIPESEYHALQVVAANARADYIAVNVDPAIAPNALVDTPTAAEWSSAIEALDGAN